MGYQPLENYGIIGDNQTIALVGMNGSIDWFCFPDFDSPSIFAAILDEKKGGYFKIEPVADNINHKQFYWPETNVLVSRFFSTEGVAEVTDFMPIIELGDKENNRCIIRRVRVVRGTMKLRMNCFPAFNYGRDSYDLHITKKGAAFHAPKLSMGLATSISLKQVEEGVTAEFTLRDGEDAIFVFLEIQSNENGNFVLSEKEAFEDFKNSVAYWRNWISKCTYTGRWREMVLRSALVLKLLIYEPTGAIVAAPTCSLPEDIGGERNWDYRYTWIRDAAFTIYGLLRIGFTDEAAKFMSYIEERCKELDRGKPMQILYGVDGRHDIIEETLDHFEGYRGSRPVRIGNAAHNQLQLDIYGELMDSVYLYNKYGSPISYELWTYLRQLIDWVSDNWQKKDAGIWEVRGGWQHFVYSKLMAWVAIDRGLRLAGKRSFPANHDKWLKTRDQIYEAIMTKGWSSKRKAFSQSFDSDTLDASNLIMPLVFFVSPTDPRMLMTLDAINKPPREGGLVSNSLVHRYNLEETHDGLAGKEGTFNICTFWLVEALTRAGRNDREKLNEARLIFERMLGYANHLGLYSEETGALGEALGNFPQAFTHLSLISAAYNLNRTLGQHE